MKLKQSIIIGLFGMMATVANAVTISGTAITDGLDFGGASFASGNAAFVVFDTANDGFQINGNLADGQTVQTGTFWNGTDDFIIANNQSVLAGNTLILGNASYTLGSNSIDGNDPFGILFFDSLAQSSSVTLTQGQNYGFQTDGSWLSPTNNGDTVTYGSGINQIGTSQATLTVAAIPEPSTYALILGAAVVGFTCLRRRKQSK